MYAIRSYYELRPGAAGTGLQILEHFVTDAGGGAELELVAMTLDGRQGFFLDGKPGTGRMTNRPHHSHRIPGKTPVRITDDTYDPSIQISHAAGVIDDGT